MKQTQRHLEILDVLTRQGFVSTDDLVTHFDVSPQTIRRDLNDLAEQNKIRRHHGGASLHSSTVNTAYSARKVMQLKEKERIAREVAANIPDGSSLFIDIGTNCEIVLGNGERLMSTAAPAGPAFEAASIRCGMRAAAGAIEVVAIGEDGVTLQVIDDAPPVGICGAGLVDGVGAQQRDELLVQVIHGENGNQV